MSGTVRATSKLVGDAASIAGEIRARLNSIARDGRAAVSPGQSAWGDDEFGGKFADGEKGFATGSDNITSGTDNLGTSFGNLSTGLGKAATTLRNMEQKNKDSFRYR